MFIILLFTFICGAAALGLLAVSVKDLPAWDESGLLSSNSTLIYDKDNKLITKVGIENRVPISLSDIPENVQEAFLAAEDRRFYQHFGVDLQGIIRAVFVDLTKGGLHQGASTITQQLIRMSFLTPDKTIKRKIQEIILAVQVERHYSKEEILEMYLNKIYFGEGAYGIQSAAQTYFDKGVSDLTVADAALLASIVRAPSIYSPYRDEKTALNRRDTIISQMAEYGFISPQEASGAESEPINIKEGSPAGRQYPYPYFVDYVTEQLIEKYGPEKVYKQGLKVYTTIDPEIQENAEKIMANDRNFPPAIGNEKPQGAAVVLDPRNGEIRALVGGRQHTNKLGWNRATREPGRQPGSSFKPIIAYAPAIELKGMGPASVIDDAPVKYGNYEPHNDSRSYRGLITLRTAITYSVNIAAVKLLVDHVTIPEAINFAHRLNIDIDRNSVGASLALGTEEITPLKLAAAYAAFANQGIYTEPTAILKVEEPDGTVLEEHTPKQKQVMKPTTAYLITDMLKSAVQSGTGTGAKISRPAAGKTGTTDQGKDIWFAGYTHELVGVVWIGFDDPKPMPRSYGGVYPAPIWRQIIGKALEGKPVSNFERPPGIVSAKVDSKSGLLPGPNTPPEHMVTDLFASGTVPTKMDDTHVPVEVCATSGKLPTEYCPDRVIRTMIKLQYNVPDNVADYNERMPTDFCTIHSPGAGGQILPPDSQTVKPNQEIPWNIPGQTETGTQ
ncbi:multimodular transpeptidase-transglycosylase [Desulfocucumis palustris]|uniref:Penicillin-binding protein 1A n=1 Tax=Desulfocucumis palustris TaxID=1898651 RepID=A0A2L2X9R3_9FIRM|nr:multimodular transpeptidase-transglycosylase [Desulfocucumis palustris]